MTFITGKGGTRIAYKDWGKGQPILFSHGWPLASGAWDAQMLFFGQTGIASSPTTAGAMASRISRGTATTWTSTRITSPN